LDLQEFKKYYDVRLGRKKLVENGENADSAVRNGNSSGIASNGNGNANFHGKITSASDMAVYEQFQSQVLCLIRRVSW